MTKRSRFIFLVTVIVLNFKTSHSSQKIFFLGAFFPKTLGGIFVTV